MKGLVIFCGILPILLVLSNLQESTSSPPNQTQVVTLDENEEAQFLFVTPDIQSTCNFKLSYNGVTFNINGKETFSHKYSYEKLLRSSVHIHSAFGFFGVSLSIRNTHATDRGTYQCTFTCNTTTVIQKVKLLIYYPPGPVDCNWVDNKEKIPLEAATFFNLSVLRCNGRNSYPKADVLCYSNRKDNTLIHTPLHITGSKFYSATFWLKRHQDLSCCSVSTRFTKNIQDCDDFHSLQHSTKPTNKLGISSTVQTTVRETEEESTKQDVEQTEANLLLDQHSRDCELHLCSYTEYRAAVITLTILCVALALLIFAKPFEKTDHNILKYT
ncbi:uncharacterized protein LOC121412524 [Lytechinus variegatus]|uniref:uncharacterized protein LOC121412524 n=1 Tax=Lytechinus variegatus TaxID=7654 RepID=UPI001BB1399D|nr:uncharacterized protein LOC121412524 [Lytechinus variegatus]